MIKKVAFKRPFFVVFYFYSCNLVLMSVHSFFEGNFPRFKTGLLRIILGIGALFGLPEGNVLAINANIDIPDFRKNRKDSFVRVPWVSPVIGTGGHGHTFPGAVAPFGMVQLSPDTRNDASWDACGGYYYHDSFIYGFSHTHLSGTGVSDLGDVLFQPQLQPEFEPEKYKQRFNHDDEEIQAAYYKVKFPETQIQVELTATEYIGLQRIVFPKKKGIKWILIDLKHRDALLSSSLRIINRRSIEGHRQSKQWADNQWVFFLSRFDQPIVANKYNEDSTKLAIGFDLPTDTLLIQTALSFTSNEGTYVNELYEMSKYNDLENSGSSHYFKTLLKGNFYNSVKDMPDTSIRAYLKTEEHGNYVKPNFSNATPANTGNKTEIESEKSNNFFNLQLGYSGISDFKILKFDPIVNHQKQIWDSELARIKVRSESGSDSQLVTFYTALYHCMIHPSLASDANGSFRGRDQKIHKKDHKTYHVFSLWDTYRALHPLLSLIDKERTRDFILTMLDQFEEGGRLPVWELGSCETNCMIGFHSVPVILDAVVQGVYFSEEEQERLWRAVKHSSDYKEISYEYHIPIASELLTLYGLKLGYIDVLNQSESVSKTLEYAFDDACVAKLGRLWGYDAEAQEYEIRARRWRGLWDVETKSFRPRSNGKFLDPYYLNEVNNHYTEANAWQYRFAVPQDIEGLISHFGGSDSLERALDGLFEASIKTRGREQADITGLIGQYAHGNEPSHHMVYLYNYVGKPEKAQRLISKIQEEFYTTGPDGYIGNEDCGQMSAWHVLSALGMYPVAPGSGYWDLGVPMFDSIEVFQSDAQPIHISRNSYISEEGIIRYDIPVSAYSDFELAPWILSEAQAKRIYKQKFVELIPNYSELLPKNNRMSNDFLMIHRSLHFEKKSSARSSQDNINTQSESISEKLVREIHLADNSDGGYVPELISPRKVNRNEGYKLHIKGATKAHPVAVFVRFMDSTLNFGDARVGYYKKFKEIKTAEGLVRIPGYGAHHLLIKLEADSHINLMGSALIWAAYLDRDSWMGRPFVARYIHEKSNNYEVLEIKGNYNPQYSGGGDGALVDGVFGSEEWRSGSWQGYQSQDFETVIDLKEATRVRYLGARFLSDERAWIFLPTQIEWEYSLDGISYKPFNAFEYDSNLRRESVGVYPLIVGHKRKVKGVKARYIRVKAKNFGKLPKEHPGYDFNGDAFIFIDEVLINPKVAILLTE